MQITKEYSIAYAEVLEVLKGLTAEEFSKIPKERIDIYEQYKDADYKCVINEDSDFNDQISQIAQAIIANLFVRFIANKEDKQSIYDREKAEYIKLETEKRKSLKLNPLFEEKNITVENEEKGLVLSKKSFFERFFEKMKNFLGIGKKL